MFGGGTWEGGSCEERNADFAGETRISLERGLGAGGLGGYSTSSYVLGTLALEDAIKVRASIARRDAGGMGRRKSQTLGEPEKLSSLSETKSLSSILGCEEKTEISSFSRIN